MKKRWFAIFTIFIMVICFAGCSKKDDDANATKNIKDGLSMTATMQYSGQKAEVKFQKSKTGDYEVEVVSPSYIKGMVFTFKESGTIVSYMGMTMELEGESLLSATMSKAIINSINAVANNTGVTLTAEEKSYVIDGETEHGSFQMLLDKKSKLPTHLSIPSLGLECDLKKS